MSVEHLLRAYAEEHAKEKPNEELLQHTIQKSKEAFWSQESKRETSWLEFLYQQSSYLQKRWWLAQGAVLLLLWLGLYLSGSSTYDRRCMGILAPVFVILILPELWKNRSCGSMEIEGTAYFSLQKIYAARLLLFGMADICLLTVFWAVSTVSLHAAAEDLLIHFILPLNVTCGICFWTLCSKRSMSIFSSLAACSAWMAGWVLLISNDRIYEKFSLPVWYVMVAASLIYLGCGVLRVWNSCGDFYEADWVNERL